MPNLNKIKIPTTNNNKVLTTDENGIIKDTSIDISSVENATSAKQYVLDIQGIANFGNIDIQQHEELYNKIVEITQNFFTGINQDILVIGDSLGQTPTYELVQDHATLLNMSNIQLYIIWYYSSGNITHPDGTAGLSYNVNYIAVNYEAITHDVQSISVFYNSPTVPGIEAHFLSTTNTATGDEVTWLPTTDSQPANKKYVDQQIANIQSQINSIELTVDDILGQPESTETQN